MKVRCDSIGSVPGRADNTTECAACGAAQVHDIDNCVPCIWNKEARCLPVLNDSRLHIHSMSEEEIKIIIDGKKAFLDKHIKPQKDV